MSETREQRIIREMCEFLREREEKKHAWDEKLKQLDRELAYYTAGMICFGIAAICIFA